LAISVFPLHSANLSLIDFDWDDAEVNVTPFSSSISCADICLALRNTASLGLAAVPDIFFRILRRLFSLAVNLGFVLAMLPLNS
jgi:hypothetical protein